MERTRVIPASMICQSHKSQHGQGGLFGGCFDGGGSAATCEKEEDRVTVMIEIMAVVRDKRCKFHLCL